MICLRVKSESGTSAGTVLPCFWYLWRCRINAFLTSFSVAAWKRLLQTSAVHGRERGGHGRGGEGEVTVSVSLISEGIGGGIGAGGGDGRRGGGFFLVAKEGFLEEAFALRRVFRLVTIAEARRIWVHVVGMKRGRTFGWVRGLVADRGWTYR